MRSSSFFSLFVSLLLCLSLSKGWKSLCSLVTTVSSLYNSCVTSVEKDRAEMLSLWTSHACELQQLSERCLLHLSLSPPPFRICPSLSETQRRGDKCNHPSSLPKATVGEHPPGLYNYREPLDLISCLAVFNVAVVPTYLTSTCFS